jgi:transposase
VTDLAAQGDPNFEVTIAWRCHQQPRSAFAALSLPEGKTITEKVLASFPSCPIPEIARLGRTLRAWKEQFLALFHHRPGQQRPT